MRILPLVALALLGAGCDFDTQLLACAADERCLLADANTPMLRYPHNGAGLGTSGATTPLGMTPTRPYFAWDFDGDETWRFRFQLIKCGPGQALADCPFLTERSDPIPDIPGTTYGLPDDLEIGHRYWWRVRACHTTQPGTPCGPWSNARYFDVGRPEVLPNDLSVSGRADLVVGQATLPDPALPQTLYLFHGSGTGPIHWKDLSVPPPGLSVSVTYDIYATGAGDLNGDGYSDLAVAYQPNFGSFPQETVPIRVFLGGSAGPGTGLPITLGPQADDFGLPLGHAGDVNGDGYSDLAVCQANQRRAIVYFGGPSGPSETGGMALLSVPNAQLTKRLCAFAALSDVDADGYDDIVVAGQGQVSVFRGRSDTGAWAASADIPAPAGATAFGASLAGGDFNGDGHGDLVVTGGGGKAYLYLGGPQWFSGTFPDPIAFDIGSGFILPAGDVNNDGYADLIVDMVSGGATTGQVRIFLGQPSGAPTAIATTITNTDIANFGVSVAGAGDLTGDYFDDVVVGGTNGVVVYRGSASENELGVVKDTVVPPSGSNQFGSHLAPAY